MRCHEAEGLLAPQFSEDLDSATQHELALHLESCAACRARLQQEYELDRLVMAAVNQEAPPAADLMRRIESALETKPKWRQLSLRWRWPALAGATALVLLCAVAVLRFNARDPMHLLCQDAADDHRSEVVLHEPRNWHTSSSEIADLARRTVPAATVPQSVAGLSLQKARICGLLQASALHLVYGNGSQEVSVFMTLRRDLPYDSLPSEAATRRLHRENDFGTSVASFSGDGLGVVVVGSPDLARNVAEQLARSL